VGFSVGQRLVNLGVLLMVGQRKGFRKASASLVNIVIVEIEVSFKGFVGRMPGGSF